MKARAKKAPAQGTARPRTKATANQATKRIARAEPAPARAKAPAKPTASSRSGPATAAVRVPRRTPPAFVGAITGASAKHLALFQIVRARVTVHAALQGLLPGSAERPLHEGAWSARDVVLHLVHWDREFLKALEPALHGVRPDWADDNESAQAHRGGSAPRDLSWLDALRELNTGRQELMAALESVPEEPVTMWAPDHALGWLVDRIGTHDLLHAAALKNWRTASGI